MNVRQLIYSSFHDARLRLAMGTSPPALARARERVFVKSLTAQLRAVLGGEDIRIFSLYGRGNQVDMGTEHLLYDIQACRIAESRFAGKRAAAFYYIAAALWQIEIDFSRELRPLLFAINRLNCGDAASKLIVAAQVGSQRSTFIDSLSAPLSAGSGQVYLALVPHPEDWDDDEHPLDVWRFEAGEWCPLD